MLNGNQNSENLQLILTHMILRQQQLCVGRVKNGTSTRKNNTVTCVTQQPQFGTRLCLPKQVRLRVLRRLSKVHIRTRLNPESLGTLIKKNGLDRGALCQTSRRGVWVRTRRRPLQVLRPPSLESLLRVKFRLHRTPSRQIFLRSSPVWVQTYHSWEWTSTAGA